jgi:hypothetical protein
MLNRVLDQAQRLALHDALVVIISDFDGANAATRSAVRALAQHNDVVAVLVHDPSQSELPPTARMTVTDGELQIAIDSSRDSVRQSILAASQDRLRDVFAWTRDLGIAVLPLSAAEDPAQQLRHLMGRALQRRARGSGGAHG